MSTQPFVNKGLKKSFFRVENQDSLSKRRWQRLKSLRKIPIHLAARLSIFYLKKAMGFIGTDNEIAANYYFLSLINGNAHSTKITDKQYYFQNEEGIKFTARKHPSSDLEVFNQVWGRREYSLVFDVMNKEKPADKLTIIDAGANVGYTSLFFDYAFPSSTIFSIEPDAGNFSVLKEHIELNHSTNIRIFRCGIWSHRCNLDMVTNFRDTRDWSVQVNETREETGLKGMNLTDFIADNHIRDIDLLKIDIEGAEKFLFDYGAASQTFLSITKVIAIEIHDEEISRNLVYEVLTAHGFSYFDSRDLTIAYKIT